MRKNVCQSGNIMFDYPLLRIFDELKGVVRVNFSKKKTKLENFFHIFFCTPNKNTVKIDYYSSAENIFHVLTESNTFYTESVVDVHYQ